MLTFLSRFHRWFSTVMATPQAKYARWVVAAITLYLLTDNPAFAIFLMGETLSSTASLDGTLKDDYEDYIENGINSANPMSDIIEDKETDKAFGGRQFVYPARVETNKSPFFTTEYGLFAESGVTQDLHVKGTVKKMMGRILLTPEVMLDTARSKGAWEDAMSMQMDGLVDRIARRGEIALNLDGRGVICRINDASPSGAALVGVDSPGGITGSVFGSRYAEKGIYVAAINPATGGIRAGISKVASMATDGNSITFESAPNAAWADNDYLVKAANSSVTDPLDTEYEGAYWGLMALIDDGTYRTDYFGVDRTVYDYVNAYVNASTGALSIDTLQMLADVTDQRMNGETDLMLAHHSVRRLYIKLTQADRRYSGENLQKPDAGTKAFKSPSKGDITMGEVPIRVIRDFPYGTLMGLDTAKMKLCRYMSEKGKWVNEDGNILHRAGTGSQARDAFEAWYRQRYQYHVKLPSVCWRADGITGATIAIVRPVGG
jgi:hypothetical protein